MGEVPHRRIALIEEPDERLEEETVELLGGDDNVALERVDAADALDGSAASRTIWPSWWSASTASHTIELLREVDRRRGPARAADDRLPAGQAANTDRARIDALSKTAVMAVADSPERLVDRAARVPAPRRGAAADAHEAR